MNGNHGDSVWAQAGLTVRRTCQADAKAEPSEPTARFRDGRRLSDKSYSGDNRLVLPKSSYRRQCSAPRCRLILSWGWRSSQGFGCSPIKKIRELGSDRLGQKVENGKLRVVFTTFYYLLSTFRLGLSESLEVFFSKYFFQEKYFW